jgi:hypothetical protein
VIFSYARSEQKLKTLAHDANGSATHGTPGEAALQADAVLLAVNGSRMQDVLYPAGSPIGEWQARRPYRSAINLLLRRQ